MDLKTLFEYEKGKCVGILNGIDDDVWDPANGYLLRNQISPLRMLTKASLQIKNFLCDHFNLDVEKPLIHFYWETRCRKSCRCVAGCDTDLFVQNKGKSSIS